MPAGYGYSYSGGSGAPAGGPAVFGSRVPALPTITGPTLNQAYPNLTGTNASASSALMSELSGQLSPQTQAAIADAAASFGVSSGMPGSGLSLNRYPRDIGLASEQLMHQGIGDYSSLIPTVSGTQTVNPYQAAGLNTEIGAMNATNASAPDPTAAATYAQQLFDRYLNRLSAPAGGTGGPGSAQGLPWWQQTTTAGGASGFGPQVATTRTYGGGGPFNLQGPSF
jgi:hypothetical protein